MAFLNNLFSKSPKILTDSHLGEFKFVVKASGSITWVGLFQFIDESVNLYIHGNTDVLDTLEKEQVLSIIDNKKEYEQNLTEALNQEFENAEMPFKSIKEHFNFLSISINGRNAEFTFEEKSTFYHFNVHFIGGRLDGVSIDS
jgi:hypothetical protein